MSAFMCDDDVFQVIADHLCRDFTNVRQHTLVEAIMADSASTFHPGNNPTDWAEHMITGWITANVNALSGRYGLSAADLIGTAPTIRCSFRAKRVPLPVLYKLIECLRYQCTEDVAYSQREAHDATLVEMKRALEVIAKAIIEELPEYKEAAWGAVA